MDSPMSDPPRVEFRGISKRYPGVLALSEVGFSIAAGGVHALVGENGAGKSTLIKILAGVTQADGGELRLDGRRVKPRNAREAQALGVAVVHQELSLTPDLTVSENVFLGRWPRRGGLGLIRFNELHAQSEAVFNRLGVRLPLRRRVRGMTVGRMQLVEIARALSLTARVLLLDEPSAVLTPPELESLFSMVRRLAAGGTSVIYISHRLDEIFELADHVTVLRDGRHISTRPVAGVSRDALIRDMVGRPIEEEYPARRVELGETALRVERLSAPPRFSEATFEVRAGEVFGLTGLVGSGRSSLGLSIFGALRPQSGRVQVGEAAGPFRSPRQAQLAGIAYLPEDRKHQGLLLHRPTRENITLAHLRESFPGGRLRPRREQSLAKEFMERFGVKAQSGEAPPVTLSGGNQQKVMLARWLQRPYRVFILDEPTRGVDVGAKREVYEIMNRLAEQGAAVILISSELPEVIGLSDRIGVMSAGRLTGILENRDRNLSQEALMRLAVPAR